MSAYLKRVAASGGTIFTGGIGWVDRSGHVLASSSGGPAVDVSDRVYFKRVTATGKPYISAGLVGRKLREPIVVIAVPTRDAAGRPTGMLTGRDPADDARARKADAASGHQRPDDRRSRRAASALGPGARLEPGAAHADPARWARGTSPMLRASRADSITSSSSRPRSVPGWTIAIDRPASSVYASARRSLTLEAVSLGAALLAVLLILGLLVKRSRREIETRGEQAQSWSKYTRTLALASTPADIADVVLESVQEVFPDAVVVVTLDSEGGQETRATSRLPGWRRVAGDSRVAPLDRGADDRGARDALARARPDAARPLPRVRPPAQGAPRLPGLRACGSPGRRHRAADRATAAREERVGAARGVRRAGRPVARAGPGLRARARARGPAPAEPAAGRPAARRRG